MLVIPLQHVAQGHLLALDIRDCCVHFTDEENEAHKSQGALPSMVELGVQCRPACLVLSCVPPPGA